MDAPTEKPLSGVTVIDASSYVTGGFATTILANQGAEVIKVERIGTGDPSRGSGPPFVEGESAYFMTYNYGKKSIELDLKSEEGQAVVHDLVKTADIFVENFRPGTAEKLNVGYETLSELNDELVYCSISGFGETSPWRHRSALDVQMQGLTGIMSVTGEAGRDPVKVGIPITDLFTAMWASVGILSAFYRQERDGSGDRVELAMYDSILPLLTKQASRVFEGETPERLGTRDPVLAPYQAFETKDGYIVIGAGTQDLWEDLCAALDREDLLEDERFATNEGRVEHSKELQAEIESVLADKTVEEWTEILVEEYRIPAGSVREVADALDNDHVEAREMIKHLDHDAIGEYPLVDHPINYEYRDHGFERHAPVLGAHTDDVLESLGYTEDEITALRTEDVIGDNS
ncbi:MULTISPECIES: CaiB/BaiF CoA transferase family protein [Salinibaculum]|uniref:CaiB/BaiF CoA transferase family protein n=1 Tax=Salinibaculum TaxID=2732368 RepID=UPI0030CE7BF5